MFAHSTTVFFSSLLDSLILPFRVFEFAQSTIFIKIAGSTSYFFQFARSIIIFFSCLLDSLLFPLLVCSFYFCFLFQFARHTPAFFSKFAQFTPVFFPSLLNPLQFPLLVCSSNSCFLFFRNSVEIRCLFFLICDLDPVLYLLHSRTTFLKYRFLLSNLKKNK